MIVNALRFPGLIRLAIYLRCGALQQKGVVNDC